MVDAVLPEEQHRRNGGTAVAQRRHLDPAVTTDGGRGIRRAEIDPESVPHGAPLSAGWYRLDTPGASGPDGYAVAMGGGPPGRLAELVEAARQIALDHARNDLAERLERSSELAGASGLRVLVAGDFKQGKSTLV